MRTITVIGIGMGSPEHLTLEAIAAIRSADAFLMIEKGTAADELVAIRETILDRVLDGRMPAIVRIANPKRDAADPDYRAGVDRWHGARVALYSEAIAGLPDDAHGAFLVWGDPAFYDSTIRILDQAATGRATFALKVIPGISAPQALAAAHGIPLNRIGEPIHVTTGRRLAAGPPHDLDSTVVMLDDGSALEALDPDGIAIWWGAYLGTPDEVLVAGPLGEVKAEILRLRREKRSAKGWIMDTYLLRRIAG
ncbi:MAG: precorrin-6A synthase (deacetylating) [Phreatobacter sp.]|uniref:precorrin-6A synthase (deacetylating) n=1 Tax=Phreatobacter sp. TaxID=1966341 RepID=UPI001A571FA1|nr:precorrin-6A synthase (deacetylating) [Phreatobacter sp.]MBL8570550.1 precorrin-6A synthase (deacetylating) [Phreatobacter sp.]